MLQAQDFETLASKNLSTSGMQPSYLVNQEGRLKPGFTFKASTEGVFFLSANRNVNGIASSEKNSVRVESLQKKITNEQGVIDATYVEKSTTYEFFNGLGRSLQTIQVKASPELRDVVSFQVFDRYGREPKKYLPYTIVANGEFRAQAEVEQKKFYNETALISKDNEAFSVQEFAPNTNELSRAYAPGWSWHHDAESKPTTAISKFNAANEVQYWPVYSGSAPPKTTGYYSAGTLTVSETITPNGQSKIQYTNSLGKVILERQGSNELWRATYFVYDHGGSLCFAFPPEAVQRLTEYSALSVVDQRDFLNRWCYQYRYDECNRQVDKRLPGADWVFTIFDNWDRPVYSQDGEQRLSNQWIYTKYDIYNREVIKGITTGDRSSLTTALRSSTSRYISRANNNVGYENGSLPAHSIDNILAVSYYDDYAFINYTGWEDNGSPASYNFLVESGYPKPTDVHQLAYPASSQYLPIVKGRLTGTKVRLLGTNTWINAVTYYDKNYKLIQQVAQNHLGSVDRATTVYDFVGRPLKELQRHGANIITIQKEYTYDHAGRPLRVYHQIDTGPKVILSDNKYNELGQLIEKNLHSVDNGVTFLQSLDYRYNIQGWLTSINNSKLSNDQNLTNNDDNDLFGFEIAYNQSATVNGVASKKLYHGNISTIKWNTNNLIDSPQQKIYAFDYDVLDRLKMARFASLNGSNWNGNANMFNEAMQYDVNGNIKTLMRNGKVNGAAATIDNLVYQYASLSSSKSNAVRHVVDKSTYWTGDPSFGYTENDVTHANYASDTEGENNTEYEYYLDGNLKSDLNKEILQIDYNYLDFPERIQLSGNREIIYQYDAFGGKVKSVTRETLPTKLLEQIDYVGAIQYYNGKLASIETLEGRVVRGPSGYEYEYAIRDHQQNIRVVFGSGGKTSNYLATMEAVRATKEAQTFKSVAGDATFNRTERSAEIVSPLKSSKLNSAISGGKAVGPSIMLFVKGGDNIQSEVFGRYTAAISGTNTLVPNITSLVTTGLGLSATGETQALFNSVTNYLPAQAAAVPASANYPKAYLCYIILEKNGPTYNAKQFGYSSLTDFALNNWQQLSLDVHVPEAIADGVVFVYVANESKINAATSVFFDDLKITHQSVTPSLQVYQSSDYYPFGLSFNKLSLSRNYYNSANASVEDVYESRLKFQGQELQASFDLGWYHYKYRMHDPSLGRFSSLDPLAEEYKYNSVYAFSENRLTDGIELEGAEVLLGPNWAPNLIPQMDVDLSWLQTQPIEYETEFTIENYYYNDLAFAGNVAGGLWNGLVGTVDFLLSPRYYRSTLEGIGSGINNYFTEPDFLGRNYDIAVDFLNDPHAADKIGTFALSAYLPKVGLGTPTAKPYNLGYAGPSGRTTIIGEGMKRVEVEAAKHPGAVILNDMPEFTGAKYQITSQMMTYNRQWFLQRLRTGDSILDLGFEPGRKTPSIFFQMEQNMLKNYLKIHPKAVNVIKL